VIALNDFAAQWREIRADVHRAVDRVGERGHYILSEEVARFEGELAEFWGLAHAVGCGSGHDAIELGLVALGLETGQKVLTTPLSSFATTLAIVRAGGVPVFVDVDEDGLLDLEACARVLDRDSTIRFLVLVHLYGRALDTRQVAALASRVHVVEDGAQAIGARSQGEPVGLRSSATCTSFYPTKNLGCLGDGGALLTRDAALAARVRSLRDYGRVDRHRHAELGMNSRLDELQAAILRSVMLPRLPEMNARRAAVAAAYLTRIEHPRLVLPRRVAGNEPAWHLFPVRVTGDRDAFRAHLEAEGIESGMHFPVLIPDQPALAEATFEVAGSLERAQGWALHQVSLPIHPQLSDDDVSRVVSACNRWRA